MSKLNSSTRLKVKGDTFFLPDSEGGVYFRNNSSSFRMEGNTIYQWIEKLIPMFNGEKTLGELTDGLTAPYRDRVYEIGETLYKSGFVRDISKDAPHQLNNTVLEKYASQIEFIENFVDSGAYHFQQYRQAKVLAVGSGSFLVSLVSALIESGLPKLNVMITDASFTNRRRLNELVHSFGKAEPDVEVVEAPFHNEAGKSFWKEAIQPYDCILYVSHDGNVNELRTLDSVCKEEGKSFISAICLEHVGISGPFIHPESEGCWESAWRRIHGAALDVEQRSRPFSSTTESLLANVTVFEFFKNATGIAGPNESNQIYFLDFDTLEGDWLSFTSHPLSVTPKLVEDLDVRLRQESERNAPPDSLLEYFSQLTSDKIGIFHTWEERDLTQLPLAQCYVQAADPVSEGPAELLPEVVCAGLTHEEAKREAGLTGIEMYVSQIIDSSTFNDHNDRLPKGFMGIGAGETIGEAICRGLQVYLEDKLSKRKADYLNTTFHLQSESIEDQHCRFYLKALTTLNGPPTIGLKENILGFPVMWVRSKGCLYTGVGLNQTMALRKALQHALLDTQNHGNSTVRQELKSVVFLRNKQSKLEIPSCDELTHAELLQSAIQVLNQNNKRLFVYDLAFESFFKQELAGMFGVQVREGES